MAQAETSDVFSVSKDQLFEVVTRYELYPEFVDGMKEVSVERKAEGKARVSYLLSMMGKDIRYSLDLTEHRESGSVKWELVESDFFKKNNGFWEITPAGEKSCSVKYGVDVEFKMWVPGPILNTLVKGSLPSMLKSFKERCSNGG